MKSLTKRNLTLIVLSVVVALCSLTFAATVKPARAEETAVNNVTVMEAASVRVGLKENEYSGIRFRVILDEATKNNIVDNDNVQLGFIITPKYYFDKALEAKATAEAEDGSYDFLTEMKKDNPENFAEDKQHAYVGIAGEGLLMENDDEATKIYQYKGEWVASAAVENIKEANRDLQFTMIAYLKTDSTIEYFLPEDTTFSRAYLQTAHKSVVGGSVSLDVISQSKDESIKTIGTEENPAQVVDSADLYNISKSANEYGIDYAGTYFDLTEKIEVNNDYVKIPSSFAGTFVENDNSVKIINGGTALMSIFEDEEDGANVKCTHTLFTITDSALNDRMATNNSNAVVDGFVSKETIKEELPDAVNPVDYDGNAVKWHTVAAKNVSHIYIKPFFTKNELASLTQYNAVRFSFMTSAPEKMHNSNTDDVHSLISMSYGSQNNTDGLFSTMAKYYMSEIQTWRTFTLPISQVLDAYTNNTTLRVNYENNTATQDIYFYLGDIELIEEPKLYYENLNAKNSIHKVTPVVNRAEGDETTPTVARPSSNSQENGIPSENGFISYENLPTFTSGACPKFVDRKIPKIALTKNANVAMYARLCYNAEQIEKFAGLIVDESGNAILDENDKRQYSKYKEISITYAVDSASAQKFAVLLPGVITEATYDKWITITLDIETFTTKFMGKTSFVDADGNTCETSGYSTTATTRDDATGVYSGKQTIVADETYFENMLFLGYFTAAGSATNLYIADISFVTPVA